ncbi:MAG: hypothetical protein AAF203_04335 [Pseudomonadota bacterium]
MSYIAAIDIGSNAIRLAIAHQTPQGLHISYRSREPVRLGSCVFSEGQINEDTYEDLKNALNQFKNQLENHNVHHFRAIATSAMREASNNEEVIESLLKDTGLKIELISGEEEARLVSLAISKQVDLSEGNYLLIDIGGGSIELVAMIDGKISKKQSYVLGMVRVLEMQKEQGGEILDWLPARVQTEMGSFFEGLPNFKTAVGTGGNMDRFIKLKSFVSDEDGIGLSFTEMNEMSHILHSVSYKDRILKFCLKPDRADVIIPAIVATNKMMTMGGCKDILFPQVGLKDGVLQELAASL